MQENKTPTGNETPNSKNKLREGVNLGALALGAVLTALGALYLLQNLGFITNININIWDLWPLALVFIGLSLISKRKRSGIIGIVFVLCLLSIIGLFFIDDIGTNCDSQSQKEIPIAITRDNLATSADISIKTGAGTFIIGDASSSDFIIGSLTTKNGKLLQSSTTHGGIQSVDITQRTNNAVYFGKCSSNLLVKINPDIPTNISIDLGASIANIDLKNITVKNFFAKIGASDVNIQFGDKIENLTAVIDTGASSLGLSFPNNVGIRITLMSGVSGNNLSESGFTKTGNNIYESSGYLNSTKKIEAIVKLGAAQLNVTIR